MPAIRHTFVAGGDMIDRFDFVNAIALWAIGYRQQAMLCAVCLRGVQFLGVHWRMRTAATCCCSSAKKLRTQPRAVEKRDATLLL